jgi:type VI secretion system protein ImpL
MKRALIGILIFAVYLACVVAMAFALHFTGQRFLYFCLVLGLLGAIVTGFAIWYLGRIESSDATAGSEATQLHALLRDAERKLRNSRLGVKSLTAAQIIYMVGEENSAKTETVMQSGLDAELLAGNLKRDGAVASTELANLWLAGSTVIVEAGGALLKHPALWQKLIRATRPGAMASLFASRARQRPRVIVVCVSVERVPGSSEAGYDGAKVRASAQTLNERLRQLSQELGISLPVYVLFTKLDTLKHFEDYVGRLSSEEVAAPLGALVAPVDTGAGLYGEQASALIKAQLDELIFHLAGFRVEVLARGGEAHVLAGGYEFPRDLQKRRNTIADYLVELTRPSQLSINPFLRGVFFSGMRAVLIESAVAAAVPQPQPARIDTGATGIFSFGGAPVSAAPAPVRSSVRKVPQWAFLPNLFAHLLLEDQSALNASRVSTRPHLLRRVMLVFVCMGLAAFLILLSISFFDNRALEQKVYTLASTTVYVPAANHFVALRDVQNLDDLGTALLTLDGYRKEGAPLKLRWGLYSGDRLYPIACDAYGRRFQALLLAPAQTDIVRKMNALRSPPAPGADYTSVYRPLKAYLMSTSNPEKSGLEPGFLAPLLLAAWNEAGTAPADVVKLSRTQFERYADFLAQPGSCMTNVGGRPQEATVNHARAYLNGFEGFHHIYQSMLANTSASTHPIRFNEHFPGSARYITDNYEVPGAFTKAGFALMQNAITHPDSYFSGEEWVLGPTAGPAPNGAALTAQLQKQYVADYLNHWRNYMQAAHFVLFKDWNDAAGKLSALNSNSSALLQLFSLVSVNTGVAQQEIAATFQPPQAVVPPSSPDNRPTAPSNLPYIQALQGLEQAIKTLSQNPLTANDPAAAVPVIQAAGIADQAAENLRNSFNHDAGGRMDGITFDLLEDPIKSAEALAKAAPAAAASGAAKGFCAQASPVLTRFPFAPQSGIDASPEQVAQIFSPGQGALTQLYAKISPLLTQPNGGQYMANPSSAIQINPAFLRFFNAAERVSSALFPAGGTQPTLSLIFSAPAKFGGSPDATLNIDGQQVGSGQSVPIHWVSQPASTITLTTPDNKAPNMTGPWSIFHLAFSSARPAPNLEFTFQFNGQTNKVVHFNVEGTGAPLLNPSFMSQLHCVSTIAK